MRCQAKLIFRKNNTNGTSKEKVERLVANVRDALSSDNRTIERIRKFVRKARDFKMVYWELFKTLDLMQSALATTAEEANERKE